MLLVYVRGAPLNSSHISDIKRYLIRLDSHLFCMEFMFYLCYLYLFTYTGLQHDFRITIYSCLLTVTRQVSLVECEVFIFFRTHEITPICCGGAHEITPICCGGAHEITPICCGGAHKITPICCGVCVFQYYYSIQCFIDLVLPLCPCSLGYYSVCSSSSYEY